jgi:hypothetical protein
MTPQEQQLITDLLRKLQSTRLDQKDAEAEQLIRQQFGNDPDALYKLVQTVLVQNFALDQAQARITQLQQQAERAQEQPQEQKTSFLGGLFGHKDEPKPQQAPPQPQPSYTQPPQQAPQYAPPSAGAPMGGGGSSFLRSAATTAAGVAAGALAFEGVESLLHGFGGHGGGSFLGGSGYEGAAPGSETIINNYYENAPGQSQDQGDRVERSADDRNDDDARYQTASDQDDSDQNADDYDDSGDDDNLDDSDDGGGFDDSGSDFA